MVGNTMSNKQAFLPPPIEVGESCLHLVEEAKAKCDESVANFRKELTICKTMCQNKWMDNPKWLDDKIYSLARGNKNVRPNEIS